MLKIATHRPRNVDAVRAASILYGDLGTSKAYVIGLAFALTGYASFWLILAVSILTVLIGINYIIICKLYPNGGGVYASVRKRSRIISLIGAFFLIADYLVTAALSSVSAFSYLGVSDPVAFSALFIALIGLLNFFGPKHTGTVAFIVALITVLSLICLALLSLPFIETAAQNIKPLEGTPLTIWTNFVGVILALSGIEAIANATGVMRLDPGSTEAAPLVTRTSTKAIIWVIAEVSILTAFFAFVTAAISHFQIEGGTVNAPGNPNVRDYMLKYLAEVFGSDLFGPAFGRVFSLILSSALGILLLSAVNTAIGGLIALQYIMAGDGELPWYFQKLNNFGVPVIPLVFSTAIPVILVILFKDVAGLAALYAIGFVGAIATNLGSTSTDRSLSLKTWERSLMFFCFLIMLAVEITLFVDKPEARIYALVVILGGLVLRGLSLEYKERRIQKIRPSPILATKPAPSLEKVSILCPIDHPGKALQLALQRSVASELTTYLLFIRTQEVITEEDQQKKWEDDEEAIQVLEYAKKFGKESLFQFSYIISDSRSDIIAAYAMRLEVQQIIIDVPTSGPLSQRIKGKLKRELRKNLPDDVLIEEV